jgi:putative RecB family exonuclease
MKVEFEICEGVSMIGFIDRISMKNNSVEIVDYKTGKRPRKNYEADKVQQIFLYGLAVSKLMDTEIGKGKLLFLGGDDPGIVSRSITSQVIEETEAKLIQDALQISSAWDKDSHPATTGPLCGWCDFFPYCAEGQEYVIGRLESGSFRKDAPAVQMMNDEAFIQNVKNLNAISKET